MGRAPLAVGKRCIRNSKVIGRANCNGLPLNRWQIPWFPSMWGRTLFLGPLNWALYPIKIISAALMG